jgi:hypothetical protein
VPRAVAAFLAAAFAVVLYYYTDTRVAAAAQALGPEVRIGAAEVGLTGTLTLTDVRAGDAVDVAAIEAAVGLSSLLAGSMSADEIDVDRPRVRARLEGDTLDLGRLLHRGGRGGGGGGSGRPLRRIVIRGGEIDVDLGARGTIHARDVEIQPQEGGVRVVLGPTRADLVLGAFRVTATFARGPPSPAPGWTSICPPPASGARRSTAAP